MIREQDERDRRNDARHEREVAALKAAITDDPPEADDDGSGGGGSGSDKLPTRATEIEREIASALDKPPHNDLLYTPLEINCSGISAGT